MTQNGSAKTIAVFPVTRRVRSMCIDSFSPTTHYAPRSRAAVPAAVCARSVGVSGQKAPDHAPCAPVRLGLCTTKSASGG